MDKKLVITKLPKRVWDKEQTDLLGSKESSENIITALFENNELVEVSCEEEDRNQLLGNIYIGKVKNIVSNISAAFIEIADGVQCYYSFEDNKKPIYTWKENKGKLQIGDELLVQVSKENIKTKAPVVTSNLNLTGKYMVLTTGNTRIGVSNKISPKHKARLKEMVQPFVSENYGFVIRTNARDASANEILCEIERLIEKYENIVQKAPFRTCFSLIEQSIPEYIAHLRDTYSDDFTKIITDCTDLYEEMKEYLQAYQYQDYPKLVFYEDKLLSLAKLYSIEVKLIDALKERVWLKSGAYLIIQQTEAFVVIDVNTGKFAGHKNLNETFLKINLEAAKEVAKQLRLRNLSGIIIVDFIDMAEESHKQQLLEVFDEFLRKDPVKTTLIGMTKLNLVELTRKKGKKSLRESLACTCPNCNGSGYLLDTYPQKRYKNNS